MQTGIIHMRSRPDSRSTPQAPCEMTPLEPRRLLSAGQLDPTFAQDGSLEIAAGWTLVGVANEQLHYSTQSSPSANTTTLQVYRAPLTDLSQMTLLHEATYESRFGIQSAQLLEDGSVIISHTYSGVGGQGIVALKRITADGQTDPAFPTYTYDDPNDGGPISLSLAFGGRGDSGISHLFGTVHDPSIEPVKDNVLIVGNADGSYSTLGGQANFDFNGDGTLDAWRFSHLGDHRMYDLQWRSLPDGNWLAYGQTDGATTRNWIIARLLPDFSLDTTFGDNGFATDQIAGQHTSVNELHLDNYGNLLIQIRTELALIPNRLVMLQPEGTPHPWFQTYEFTTTSAVAAIQSDDRIVINENGTHRRLRADGIPDETYTPFQGIVRGTSGDDLFVQLGPDPTGQIAIARAQSGLQMVPGMGEMRLSGGDFDGDGQHDIFTYDTTTGQTSLWLMDGATRRGQVSLNTVENLAWRPAGIGDFNGDGKADIVWRNSSTGGNLYWSIDNLQRDAVITLPATKDLNWRIAGVGNFDGDGFADLVWQNNQTRATSFWLNDGANITFNGFHQVGGGWRMADAVDGDGDGSDDLLWHNTTTGQVLLWKMSGTTLTGFTTLAKLNNLNWSLTSGGDLDNDGQEDLLWWNAVSGQHLLWQQSGTSTAAMVPLPRR